MTGMRRSKRLGCREERGDRKTLSRKIVLRGEKKNMQTEEMSNGMRE